MGANKEYLIPFDGLENGIHNYRFQVSTDFFEKFENSRIQKGDYVVDLIFEKRDQMMVLDFSFEGKYHAACDRCLALIDIPNEGGDQIIVKLKSRMTDHDHEEVVILDDDAHDIDVSSFIHDMIHLHLPLVNEKNCADEDYEHCDHDVLDKLENDDDKGDDDGGNWDSLKNLKLD